MKQLKERRTALQSKRKIVAAINLFERYVDEYIRDIQILSSDSYVINGKWKTDITTNKVKRVYPDPEW